MPAIRANPSKRGSCTSRTSELPIHEYSKVSSSIICKYMQRLYENEQEPEFRQPHPEELFSPISFRPNELQLKNLNCLKAIRTPDNGVHTLLVSSNSTYMGVDDECLLSMKCVPRKMIRAETLYMHDEEYLGKYAPPRQRKFYRLRQEKLRRNHFRKKDTELASLVQVRWNPFITGLVQTFYDSRSLYYSLEYIPGLTLQFLLQKTKGSIGPNKASFYFGNIVCALEFLHDEGVVHRNLKPESLLIGPDGYLVLTDFDNAAVVQGMSQDNYEWLDDLGSTYLAPECMPFARSDEIAKQYPTARDWWAAGCILYEMIVGQPPFLDPGWELLSSVEISWPPHVKTGAKFRSLVTNLLSERPKFRYGVRNLDRLKNHVWLSQIDWKKMTRRVYKAPFIPKSFDPKNIWHDFPLPQQREVPGLHIVKPLSLLPHDDCHPESPANLQ